ncbi:MAG: Fe2+-dependent dioxygenase [Pseudomonadota bacterium]
MILTIGGILDTGALAKIQAQLPDLDWKDGSGTAGPQARAVKRNLQADFSKGVGQDLRRGLREAIAAHPVFRAAAQPRQMSPVMLSRTAEGGGYGLHVDNAIMQPGSGALRTDLSFTLFLSDPDTYSGGDLVIDGPGSSQSLKPQAGDLVLYPSTHLHRVETVTSGVRHACVGWVESLVRDPVARETLFDLHNLRASLASQLDAQSADLLTLNKAIANLLRVMS